MTSKQRAYLRGLAASASPVFNVGKESLTPGITEAIGEYLEKNELVKISILKNCADDPRMIAEAVADRTHSEVVAVIGKKFILYKRNKDEKKRKIELPE